MSLSAISSSSDALDGFCVLARTSSGYQNVLLIKQVLKHANIWVFGELLEAKNIQELQNTEHQPWLDLLRLFAYGTYQDYKNANPPLPPLSAVEINKLKCLSIVTYASRSSSHILTYSYLLSCLSLSSIRQLEDMIIECIYSGLLDGKLDQNNECVEIISCMGRDIGPLDIDNMITVVDNWVSATDSILETLDGRLKEANKINQINQIKEKEFDQSRKHMVEMIKQHIIVAHHQTPLAREGGAGNNANTLEGKLAQAVSIVMGNNEGDRERRAGGEGGGSSGVGGGVGVATGIGPAMEKRKAKGVGTKKNQYS